MWYNSFQPESINDKGVIKRNQMVLQHSKIHQNLKLVSSVSPLAIHPCSSRSNIFCQDLKTNTKIEDMALAVLQWMHVFFFQEKIMDQVKNILNISTQGLLRFIYSSSFILHYNFLLMKEFNKCQKSQLIWLILIHQMYNAFS